MGYENRDYHRTQGGGGFGGGGFGGGGFGGGGNPFWRLLSWLNESLTVGTYLGIRVRVLNLFLAYAGITLLLNLGSAGFTAQWLTLLFLSVLLHEFGHCLACRSVGGRADDILMWPLGGLAFCDPPRRPWPEFVTVVWGPLVNLLISLACYAGLWAALGAGGIPVGFNPFDPWLGTVPYPQAWPLQILTLLFLVNWYLMCFNLAMVFYPFDGGRLVQIGLWAFMGYRRSMYLSCNVGMGGAVLVGLVGLFTFELLLVLIAVFGFITCQRQLAALQAEGPEEPSRRSLDPDPPMRRGGGAGGGVFQRWQQNRKAKAQQRQDQQRRRMDQEVDRILAKVKSEGINSLSGTEKKTLQRATQMQRKS